MLRPRCADVSYGPGTKDDFSLKLLFFFGGGSTMLPQNCLEDWNRLRRSRPSGYLESMRPHSGLRVQTFCTNVYKDITPTFTSTFIRSANTWACRHGRSAGCLMRRPSQSESAAPEGDSVIIDCMSALLFNKGN